MLKSTFLNILSPILPSSKGFIAKLVEFYRGTTSLKLLKEYEQSDMFNRMDLNNIQIKKFNDLIKSIYKNNIYYSNQFKENNKEKFLIKTLDEISEFNILSKNELRIGLKNRILHKNMVNMRYELATSGGTSGDPVTLYMDRNARSHGSAALLRYYGWWDVQIGDKMAVLWGRQLNPNQSKLNILKSDLHRLLGNRLFLNTFVINDKILSNHYSEIFNYNPIILRGYANSLYLFAKHIDSNNLKLWSSLKIISSTSEKLTVKMKDFIEKVFKKPVTNQYGCGEVYGAAFECPEGRNIHIAEEHVYIECLNASDEPVYEEEGRIVITDLDNYITPLIRYEVGDLGIITNEKCICGRIHKVIKEITGRLSDELLLANNNKIAPSYWSVLFRQFPEIDQACIIAVSKNELIIDFLLNNDFNKKNILFIKKTIKDVVGDDIILEFRKVKRIMKTNSGKHEWVIKKDIPGRYNTENIIKIL